MNTKEAIERIKTRFTKWDLDNEDLTALQVLGLIDADSEDERIREAISYAIGTATNQYGTLINGVTEDEAVAYLEKQKDEAQKQFNLGVQAGREEVMYEIEKEQHPAEWSEEEHDYYDAIIAKLEVTQNDAMLTDEQMSFLKSIPEMFNRQPNQEWSEKDEEQLKGIIDLLPGLTNLHAWLCGIKQRLKSITPRHITYTLDAPLGYDKDMNPIYPPINHWKPNNEQMEWLESAVKLSTDKPRIHGIIISLYEQLKRL